ncbi:hypothetical protein Tco_0875257 [Tanacetum coccineum]|uniref:Peptidase A2 domain-containing protein n=1 Tax=Tanacetum coccineum TaxID=301880 RepID=A0ABQ5BNY3_9ASTR
MVFHQMDTEEVSDRFVSPCFVNGLEAYDGEINLGVEKNMISNEYAVKLYLEHEDIEEEEKSLDDWDHLLDFNLDYISLLGGEELSPFICKMGKSSHNKKRSMENLSFFYQDIGISSSAGGHLTQEEGAKESLAIRISQKFALLEELRHVIETMAYQDKYKKILDEIWKDKVELDGKIMNEEEEAVKSIKGEALKEKDDPGAFIFHIRLERQVNKNALADTGSDINTMPYRIYEQLGREEMKKVDRGIMMINHTQAEAMGILINHVNWKPDYKGSYTKEEEATGQWRTEIRLTDVYGNIYLQGFTTKKIDRKLSKLWEHTMMRPDHQDPNALDNMKPWKRMVVDGEIDDMLRIRLREAESNKEMFTYVAWIRAFNINEPIYAELCHEFYSTYEFDEVCADDELQIKKIIKFRIGGHAYNLTLYDKIQKNDLWLLIMFDARHQNSVLTDDVVRSLSALIYCRDLDTTPLRDLIDFEGKLIPEDPYQGVFEHMAGVYSALLQGAYNPAGYAQPQYDQYYQQYPPLPP